ncbi:hypothetical protein [Bacillus sp. M6-12]|uniref:hypothetical protein n=1 Tax=Bacillus sp. M6-12 TaxID=2054166 RepID=UPI0015E151DD|nr:hypothetical protein [Bacillus sp. M6-12]
MSLNERNKVISQLGLTDETTFTKDHIEVYHFNNIGNTYKGSIKEDFILQAEFK